MTLFQSFGIVVLLVVMSSNRARYGIMASKPSFRISQGTPSGPIDLFLLNTASRFLIVLLLMVNSSPEFYLRVFSLAAEYRSVIGIKGVGLIY